MRFLRIFGGFDPCFTVQTMHFPCSTLFGEYSMIVATPTHRYPRETPILLTHRSYDQTGRKTHSRLPIDETPNTDPLGGYVDYITQPYAQRHNTEKYPIAFLLYMGNTEREPYGSALRLSIIGVNVFCLFYVEYFCMIGDLSTIGYERLSVIFVLSVLFPLVFYRICCIR